MRVGIAVHNYDAAEGTGGYVVALLPYLAREHEITLYAARVRSPVPDGVRVVRVPAIMRTAYTAILTFPAALRRVRGRHDLLHAQGWVTASADIVTAHIVLGAWRTAARAARVRAPFGERFFGGFVQAREAALFRKARHVIVPSAGAQRDVALHYGRTADVTVIPHGFPSAGQVPARGAARRALHLPADPFVALFVGDPRKGLATAIQAVADTSPAHLAVVSRSESAEWLALAGRLGAGPRVHWLGSREDMGEVYAAADVLLHPTICDSFGMVVAEAMANGIPPVVTSAAGIAELIQHGESGWIVEGEPVAGSRAALQALAGDPALRQRLGTRARVVAAGRSWEAVAGETSALYRQAAAR